YLVASQFVGARVAALQLGIRGVAPEQGPDDVLRTARRFGVAARQEGFGERERDGAVARKVATQSLVAAEGFVLLAGMFFRFGHAELEQGAAGIVVDQAGKFI